MSDLLLPTGLSVSQFIGLRPGPKLIVLGAVHGNETCGTEAIQRTRQEIERGVLRVECGILTMVPIANPLAYQLKRRHGDRNLNRYLRIADSPQDFEDAVSSLSGRRKVQHRCGWYGVNQRWGKKRVNASYTLLSACRFCDFS